MIETQLPEFQKFTKIPRLSREVVVTEKIDGSNAQILINDDGSIFFGSRNRWLSSGKSDNFGFYAWGQEHKEDLLKLGPGRHYGEWWGSGIQRGYGLAYKKLSLFNITRWCLNGNAPQLLSVSNDGVEKYQEILPPCVDLVPVLYRGVFCTESICHQLKTLETEGSVAASGFMDPEGVVIFHTAAGIMFKKTIKDDESHKSLAK